eukprot:SAG31_NODE_331_length_17518_cov_32.495042_19_plen_81_part_01
MHRGPRSALMTPRLQPYATARVDGIIDGHITPDAPRRAARGRRGGCCMLPGDKVLSDAFPLSNLTSVALYLTPVLTKFNLI